jgi:SEL1 protein
VDEDEKSRLEKAASFYQAAADTQISALAMWNLGWMYENGVGVPQVPAFLPRSQPEQY